MLLQDIRIHMPGQTIEIERSLQEVQSYIAALQVSAYPFNFDFVLLHQLTN